VAGSLVLVVGVLYVCSLADERSALLDYHHFVTFDTTDVLLIECLPNDDGMWEFFRSRRCGLARTLCATYIVVALMFRS
jgi:hypothetical protein